MSELHELLQADKASPTVFHHLMVPEPHDAVPLRRDRAGPLGIRLGGVLPAVDFHDQLQRMAGEVDDIVADRHLAAKSGLGKGFPSQRHIRLCATVGLLRSARARAIEMEGGCFFTEVACSGGITPFQLRLGPCRAKPAYPSPIEGEGGLALAFTSPWMGEGYAGL